MLTTLLRRATRNHLKNVTYLTNQLVHTKCDDTESKEIATNTLKGDILLQKTKDEPIIEQHKNISKLQNDTTTAPINSTPIHKMDVLQERNINIIDTRQLPSADYLDFKFEKKSALDTYDEDISDVAPYLKPTFNIAAYVNKSETLQKLLQLGVELYKLECNPDYVEFILGLNFEDDIKNHVQFFSDLGLEVDVIGKLITKNPFILKNSIEDMKIRINYLVYKKFTKEMIIRILSLNHRWLNFSTHDIDMRLGFFQKQFRLNGNEVRQLATKQPKLITYRLRHLTENRFSLCEEMGFTDEEMKSIVLNKPKLLMRNHRIMMETFEYVHITMKIPLEIIAKFPEVLTCRAHRLKQRHLFLEELNKIQFNPKLPNYIGITSIITGTDAEFCEDVAKCSVQTYNTFLKSL